MNAPMPAMGKSPAESHGKTLFAALLLGILCTLCIYTYSTNNLDVLGLSPESQKARTLEIIVLLIGQTFLSFTIGKVYENNPAWAYKLGFILVILFIVDFASSYQARNAINQHQTLTKSASEEHAKLIAAQIGVAQNTAKELTDSAERQRNNKFITAGAANANKAAKQADSAAELIKLHGEAIKSIKPTEADTFGAWTGNIIFMSMLGLYLLNDAMWAFIGHFIGRGNKHHENSPFALTPTAQTPAPERSGIATPNRSDSGAPSPALQRADFGTPQPASEPKAVTFDLEKAKETVRRKSAIERMPKVMPWHFAIPAIAATPLAKAQAPEPPAMPVTCTDSGAPAAAEYSDSGAPKTPRKRAAKKPDGVQMDTGTKGKAAHRYERIRKLVEDRKIRPSTRQLIALDGEQINSERAKQYLFAMCDDGLLVWNEDKRRFEYRNK